MNKTGYIGQGSAGNKTNVTVANATELTGYVGNGTWVENTILNITGYVAPGVPVNKTHKNVSQGNVTAQILCTNAYIWNTYISNGVDSDGDGYYESFDIEIDADIDAWETCGVRTKIVASTGGEWWTSSWNSRKIKGGTA